VSELVYQDQRPRDGGVDGEHESGMAAPDEHAVARNQRRVERQHDHDGHGEARNGNRDEGMQQPAYVSGPQPGQAWPRPGAVLADAPVDRGEEAELVQCCHEVRHRDASPGPGPQPGLNLGDGAALAEQDQDPVRYVRDRDEVAGLYPSDDPAVPVPALAQITQPNPRSAVDRGRGRCHRAAPHASQPGCGGSSRTSGASSAARFTVSIRPGTTGGTPVSSATTR
jgi:hypothetical protein